MKKTTLLITLLVLLLSACSILSPQAITPTQSADSLSTQIAKLLTEMPVEVTQAPLIIPTNTDAVPTLPTTMHPTTTSPAMHTPTFTSTLEVATLTPTFTETPGITPTITFPATDPVLSLGAPDFVDDMSNGNNWPTGANEYTAIAFENGFLKLTSLKDLAGWRLSWQTLTNFFLEVTLKSNQCSGSDQYGVMFRSPDLQTGSKGYLFGITCDGKYNLRKWDGKTMTNLINWTAHESILKGAESVNRLGIMVIDKKIGLYMNGTLLQEISDDAYLSGGFGIFVSSKETKNLTVWVDQVRYWIK